jgi:hypothetical protein
MNPGQKPTPSFSTGGAGPRFDLGGQVRELEKADGSIRRRNRFLFLALLLGIAVVILAVWGVYQTEIGSYAVLSGIEITRQPMHQGQIQIKFRVESPGRVRYRRVSGGIEAEVVDYFSKPDEYTRSWSWIYEPGKPINVDLRSRSGIFRADKSESFPTADSADIVVIMDTTGSMSRSIAQLKDKCVTFSEQLKKQQLKHRFALLGFGDVEDGTWLDARPFTADAQRFRSNVASVKRFDGGDLPESSLDALEAALDLPYAPGAVRRLYLVTDAVFHEPTSSGRTVAEIARRLEHDKVLLSVFSRPEFEKDYAPLLGPYGRFGEIEEFGRVLTEGRVLED